MPDTAYFKQQAARCRLRAHVATVPELKDQLRLWADEFEDVAFLYRAAEHLHAIAADQVDIAKELRRMASELNRKASEIEQSEPPL